MLTAPLSLLLFVTGCSKSQLVDERNPFYLRGKKLIETQKPEEAVEAFHKCLRLSPESAKADLQLGILYEDTFHDPAAALYFYRQYLKKRPDGENADVVKRWIQRAEKQYYRELHKQFGLKPIVTAESDTAAIDKQKQQERERVLRAERDQLASKVTELTEQISSLTNKLHTFYKKDSEVAQPRAENEQQEIRTEEPRTLTYTVAKGDTLSKISRDFYDSLKYWPLLLQYNEAVLHGRENLRPGMQLKIPSLAELEASAVGH